MALLKLLAVAALAAGVHVYNPDTSDTFGGQLLDERDFIHNGHDASGTFGGQLLDERDFIHNGHDASGTFGGQLLDERDFIHNGHDASGTFGGQLLDERDFIHNGHDARSWKNNKRKILWKSRGFWCRILAGSWKSQ